MKTGVFTTVKSLTQPLEQQICTLAAGFTPGLLEGEIEGVLLSGSCARGEATHRSDIDLLVVLKSGPLNYSRVQRLRDALEEAIPAETLSAPLQVNFQFVLASVFETQEPAMAQALVEARILVDPRGSLGRKRAA
jgi:predicted nucleotidyltransferase